MAESDEGGVMEPPCDDATCRTCFPDAADATKPCPTCEGRGKVVIQTHYCDCLPCDGTGRVADTTKEA